jgi:glycosyltransferase 2 family protein
MRAVSRLAPYVLLLAFAAWCAIALRGDLAQLSPAPLLHSWGTVLVATCLSLTNYALRAIRWRAYLARMGHSFSLRFAAVTFTAGFAYTVSPGKLGEMARARYYAPLGVPVSDVAAAFFAERLLDLVVMLVLAALWFTASHAYQEAVLGAAVAVVIGLAILTFLPWSAIAVRLKASTRIPGPALRALTLITSSLASTQALLVPAALASGFILGLVAWALEGAGLGLLSTMFSPERLDLVTAIGIYGIAVLVGGMSFLPGGLGSTEAVMTALLAMRGYPLNQALVITLTCRLVTLWFAVVLGWLAVFALREREVGVALP